MGHPEASLPSCSTRFRAYGSNWTLSIIQLAITRGSRPCPERQIGAVVMLWAAVIPSSHCNNGFAPTCLVNARRMHDAPELTTNDHDVRWCHPHRCPKSMVEKPSQRSSEPGFSDPRDAGKQQENVLIPRLASPLAVGWVRWTMSPDLTLPRAPNLYPPSASRAGLQQTSTRDRVPQHNRSRDPPARHGGKKPTSYSVGTDGRWLRRGARGPRGGWIWLGESRRALALAVAELSACSLDG